MEVHAIMRQFVRVSRADFRKRRSIYLVLGFVCALSFAYAAQGAVSAHHARIVTRFCGSIDLRPGRTYLDVSASKKFSHRFCIVGKRGARGARGSAGADGNAGAQGVPGVAGVAGPQGERGAPGIGISFVGQAGDLCAYGGWLISYMQVFDPTAVCNGAPGAQGPQGETGATGAQGPAGEQGPAGAAGPAGADGLDGQDGAPGADGAAGADGQDGVDGATGPAGPTGPQGPQGEQGPAGADGQDGAAGPAGPAGPTGPAGPQGAAGLDGSAIVTVTANGVSGQKTTVALCPAAHPYAISGGFSAQGSVTESYRNPDGHGWTVTQSSGNTDSLLVYAYCA
jgi:Collagen triple helix repeat (20 copies)